MQDQGLEWEKCLWLCTYRAASMAGYHSDAVRKVVEWLKRRAQDPHGLGSKPTQAILLCSWERHLTARFSAWWSWQAVLN